MRSTSEALLIFWYVDHVAGLSIGSNWDDGNRRSPHLL